MLTRKVALVTGGDKGIGRAVVLNFAKNGADVFFTYNQDLGSAEQTKKDALQFGTRVEYLQLDVTSDENVKSSVKSIIAAAGRIDILVNNAGIVSDGLFLTSQIEKWMKVINVIFMGSTRVTKEVLFSMINKKSGSIINICSVGGVIGIAGQTNYTSAKGTLISFTKSLSKEVARLNIRVNAIAPGYVDTDMVKKYPEEMKQRFLSVVPMKRFANPCEIADVALFLASGMSSY
jgi:3-oxoacyl-[acyl-carrier protein] reductase